MRMAEASPLTLLAPRDRPPRWKCRFFQVDHEGAADRGGFEDGRNLQIGANLRSPPILQKATGFLTTRCSSSTTAAGAITCQCRKVLRGCRHVRTPRGLQLVEWNNALPVRRSRPPRTECGEWCECGMECGLEKAAPAIMKQMNL